MAYIIISIIICIIVMAKSKVNYELSCIWHFCAILFLGMMTGVLVGFILWLTVGHVAGQFLPETEIVMEQELMKFPDSHYIQNDGDDISYMIESDGTYCIENVSIDDVLIHYQNQKPVVKKHKYKLKEDWWGIWIAVDSASIKDYTEIYLPAEE